MDKTEAKVLIIDDDRDVLLAAKLFLKQHFTTVHTEPDPQNITALCIVTGKQIGRAHV